MKTTKPTRMLSRARGAIRLTIGKTRRIWPTGVNSSIQAVAVNEARMPTLCTVLTSLNTPLMRLPTVSVAASLRATCPARSTLVTTASSSVGMVVSSPRSVLRLSAVTKVVVAEVVLIMNVSMSSFPFEMPSIWNDAHSGHARTPWGMAAAVGPSGMNRRNFNHPGNFPHHPSGMTCTKIFSSLSRSSLSSGSVRKSSRNWAGVSALPISGWTNGASSSRTGPGTLLPLVSVPPESKRKTALMATMCDQPANGPTRPTSSILKRLAASWRTCCVPTGPEVSKTSVLPTRSCLAM
mmetsp:Transcript_33490/g.99847  ORF Transcript_33490/g.99847 Transcript_33490/m.99847 type:complete len:294 (-) Transcript_33490:782-1663(-)